MLLSTLSFMRWRNGVESVARVEEKASHYLRRTSTPRAQVVEYFSRLLLPGELQLRVRIFGDSIHAGYLVAISMLLVIVFVTWIHASWLLEVMARAQVRWEGTHFYPLASVQASEQRTILHASHYHDNLTKSLKIAWKALLAYSVCKYCFANIAYNVYASRRLFTWLGKFPHFVRVFLSTIHSATFASVKRKLYATVDNPNHTIQDF